MLAIVIIGVILLLIPILALWAVNPGAAAGLCTTVGFLFLLGGMAWFAEYRPWFLDYETYKVSYIGFVAFIVITTVLAVLYIKSGHKHRPTMWSQRELEKELDFMTKLHDRRAYLCSLVPTDAEDPYTGKLATWQQLTDYRWCACWLAHNDRMKKIDDPAYWPHR